MDELKKRFELMFPDKIFLRDSLAEVEKYLRTKNWITKEESVISLIKPGEGNMNYVRRITTNSRTIILKQARPWAEKYPHIYAPTERSMVEVNYFSIINKHPDLKSYSPVLLGVDNDNFIIVLSDLGTGFDYTYFYEKENHLSVQEYQEILTYLSHLHQLKCETFPYNGEMRKLNHEHIFVVPFEINNGLNLDKIQPGLQEASMTYKTDQLLVSEIRKLGKLYLKEGPVLIHGDYFPGSWLKSDNGLKVIDPEFSFMSYAEIDLGIMVAHLLMAQQDLTLISNTFSFYKRSLDFNERIFAGYIGVEILRRLLGVGQLPLTLSLEEKKDLMVEASGWIKKGKIDFINYES
ncbi:phosphotransferase [Bacteroidota bacterium]